jgi:hypothetical protein
VEINQSLLLRALVKLIASVQADRAASLKLSNEVAALRKALRDVQGDDFLPLVDQYGRDLDQTLGPAMAGDVASLAEILRLIKQALPDSDP